MKTEAEIAAAKAESAAATARGFDGWKVACSGQAPPVTAGRYDQAKDHMATPNQPWGRYAPWPHEKLGAWSKVLDDAGRPVCCVVCGGNLVRTPLPC